MNIHLPYIALWKDSQYSLVDVAIEEYIDDVCDELNENETALQRTNTNILLHYSTLTCYIKKKLTKHRFKIT